MAEGVRKADGEVGRQLVETTESLGKTERWRHEARGCLRAYGRQLLSFASVFYTGVEVRWCWNCTISYGPPSPNVIS